MAREESMSAIKLHESALHQRMDADRLSDSAKKLARIGRELEADAIKLRAELDIDLLAV
jgi:hypothetical protein